ncbi:MAG: L-2-hydroxyglutarate oxidase [Armatimonadota bacterium]|nr:L-2-hydroxyglutarate oxidase [Armatimonadota bacterium]
MTPRCDVAVVGGGIVGLATALALVERAPDLRVTVLEKEADVGQHQTGHNSGVIHSGLYYRPGSAKARWCVEGGRLLRAFCADAGIPVHECGKVVVATDAAEAARLDELYARGVANGVARLELLSAGRLREVEPYAAGVRALWSPTTAVVDFQQVARALAAVLRRRGVEIVTASPVVGVRRADGELVVRTPRTDVIARWLVNCAGLYSDVVARMAGARPDVQIVPFRGEYYLLRPERAHLVRGLIYPVPDPRFPFLGVHLTRTIHGRVEAGPNAVLALAREGYTRWRVHPAEVAMLLAYPGVWRMARRYWRTGLHEVVRSFSTRAFVRALQRLVPALDVADVVRAGAGVRAQAVRPDGTLEDDFRIVVAAGAIHVLNAPSPAATSALAIGRHVAALADEAFGFARTVARA